jgi:hypothetical protein
VWGKHHRGYIRSLRSCSSPHLFIIVTRHRHTTTAMSEAPVSIIPSAAELESKQLSPQNLEKALIALHKDGLVVLENVIPLSQLEALNKIMVADAKILSSRGDDSPFNYHKGNIQQDPPLTDDLFFPEIYLSQSPTMLLLALS